MGAAENRPFGHVDAIAVPAHVTDRFAPKGLLKVDRSLLCALSRFVERRLANRVKPPLEGPELRVQVPTVEEAARS